MGCPYCVGYKDNEKYYPRLYCGVDNVSCIYTKRCQKVEKYIPLENDAWKECYKYNMQIEKDIPNGSYFIKVQRPSKNGKIIIYVVINDNVEKITTNFTEINQNYVYVKESIDGYEVSLTPFNNTKNDVIEFEDEIGSTIKTTKIEDSEKKETSKKRPYKRKSDK